MTYTFKNLLPIDLLSASVKEPVGLSRTDEKRPDGLTLIVYFPIICSHSRLVPGRVQEQVYSHSLPI